MKVESEVFVGGNTRWSSSCPNLIGGVGVHCTPGVS
jgi:hypothetical protein